MQVPALVSEGRTVFVSSAEDLLRHFGQGDIRCFVVTDGARISWEGGEPITLFVGGHTRARLEFSGAGQTTVTCTDHGGVEVITRALAAPTIRAMQSAELKVRTFGESQPTIAATDHAHVQVVACESSRPYLEVTEFSVPMVIVRDQARPRCADWPARWEPRTSDVYIGQRLICFETEAQAVSTAQSLHGEWMQCRNRYLACMRTPGAVPRICPNVVDFRWRKGTVHLELSGEANPHSWYSTDAHHLEPLTESRREACTRHYLDGPGAGA